MRIVSLHQILKIHSLLYFYKYSKTPIALINFYSLYIKMELQTLQHNARNALQNQHPLQLSLFILFLIKFL